MSKHTPGPWEIFGNTIKAFPAEAGHPSGEFRLCEVKKTTYGARIQKINNWQYNAALIAAAPDMLDALNDALEALPFHGNSNGIDCGCDDCELYRKIRSVIKRAEGK